MLAYVIVHKLCITKINLCIFRFQIVYPEKSLMKFGAVVSQENH